MQTEGLEERTVEVLQLPEDVDEELLYLYFENKRRSGGGPLESVDRRGHSAILVFEDAQAASQVLAKESHVLHNTKLSVRRPASKDRSSLLLRGLNPNTLTEMIEMYVENMIGLNDSDYTLHPSPGRDVILVRLRQPLSKDFQNLREKIAKRTLDGAQITLEQVDQTDSILVENLPPGTTADALTLYFDDCQKVREVAMLAEGTAKVSFVNHDSLASVLDSQHKLESAELVLKPFFDFLQPKESKTSQNTENGREDMTEANPDDLDHNQTPSSSPVANVVSESPSSSQTPTESTAATGVAEAAAPPVAESVVEDQAEDVVLVSTRLSFVDPVKLSVLKLSPFFQNLAKTEPTVTVETEDDGVFIQGRDKPSLERIKQTILEHLGNMAEVNFTSDPEEVRFLAREDVKERLLQTLGKSKSTSVYTVSKSTVVVTSVDRNSADQACDYLKSQICRFEVPIDKEYECTLYCKEWSDFLRSLPFSSVKVCEQEGKIDVLTLKGMESEQQIAIVQFLSTPVQRETVITMDQGVLSYIQTHCHQLLADMDQVSIFPLDSEDTFGFKICGPVVACQMAEEVLQSIISTILIQPIKFTAPGLTRFLGDEDCKAILEEMETKFQVHIRPEHTPWEDLAQQDFSELAWRLMSQKNFPRVPVNCSALEFLSDSIQTDHGRVPDGEEARNTVSAVGERPAAAASSSDQQGVTFDNEEELNSPLNHEADVGAVGSSPLPAGVTGDLIVDNLESVEEEEAELSLAIQYSMEMSQESRAEEEQLKKALELSKQMASHSRCSSNRDDVLKTKPPRRRLFDAYQEENTAASTAELVVFAVYSCDLTRVSIAFGKKIQQRQSEEKLQHRCLKNMSDYHKMCLEAIKRKHGVDVQIQGTLLTVSGFSIYVDGGVCDIKQLLEAMEKSGSNQEILKTVQWVAQDPASSAMTPYPPEAMVLIEHAWKLRRQQVDVLLDDELYAVEFDKMQEVNKETRKSVKVYRKLLDEGDLENIAEEDYTLLSNLPEATKLAKESDECQLVMQDFYATLKGYHSKIKVIHVEKLMNRLLYNQYKLKKASVVQRATYPEVERKLYHGTSEASVKEICVHGFNRSFCGKNATVYGQGVYFAVDSALSVQDQYSPPNSDGHKFIFVSRVLTGDFTIGCHTMKTAPLMQDSADEVPLRYDSVTDNLTNPTMFVIFNDTQAFPEYLITCQQIFR